MKLPTLFGLLTTSVILGTVVATTNGPGRQSSVQDDRERYLTPENSPFLEHYEVAADIWAAVDKAFMAHRFTRPFIVTRGEGGVIWFTADRIVEGKSDGFEAFDRVFVGVTPTATVDSKMVAHVHGPSDWGLRGRRFGGDLRSEAALMGKEVELALRGQRTQPDTSKAESEGETVTNRRISVAEVESVRLEVEQPSLSNEIQVRVRDGRAKAWSKTTVSCDLLYVDEAGRESKLEGVTLTNYQASDYAGTFQTEHRFTHGTVAKLVYKSPGLRSPISTWYAFYFH